MIRMGLLGANGRMGAGVTQLLETEFKSKALLVAQASSKQPTEPLLQTEVVIDFASSAAMAELAQKALAYPGTLPAFVVGSTGWKLEEKHVLEELAKKTPVLISSNFSMGVTALLQILRSASPLLEKLGYSPVIVETHHKHKKDAPSGTALSLQRAIAPAGPGNIQTHSVRAGEIIGDHEVTFYGPGDHIKLGHFAQDRLIFARGAIDVALWLATKRGAPTQTLFNMEHYFKEFSQ